ncbi:MAG TPA: hypothetical protein VGD35_13815 [Chitinophaga sp.]
MRSLVLFAIVFLMASCQPGENTKQPITRPPADLSAYLLSKVERFSLSSRGDIPDSNELVFYYGKSFDTSFLVHFEKSGSSVHGVLYEVGIPFHRDEWDVADKKDSLLFFDGYSFNIDSLRWANISKVADSILAKETGWETTRDGCADCPTYILAFNLRVKHNNSGKSDLLTGFAKYLKDSLLNQYITKRQPKLHKSN